MHLEERDVERARNYLAVAMIGIGCGDGYVESLWTFKAQQLSAVAQDLCRRLGCPEVIPCLLCPHLHTPETPEVAGMVMGAILMLQGNRYPRQSLGMCAACALAALTPEAWRCVAYHTAVPVYGTDPMVDGSGCFSNN